MTEKSHIVRTLGESGLLLPSRVNAGLAANDRIKFYLTLLQTARSHAERPDLPAPNLGRERAAAGVADEALDRFVVEARRDGDGVYRMPGVATVVAAIGADLAVMLDPLEGAAGDVLRARGDALAGAAVVRPGDIIDAATVDALAATDRDARDTVHLVVMDAHKGLNALQAEIAVETIDGASVYGIADGDRGRIRAFMRGVRRTAPLKFDHPGLGTTATRVGPRLVLQNDIGTTDAHVLVIRVEGPELTLTYTDVHLQRLLFFQGLFEGRGVEWDDTRSRRDDALEDGVFHLSSGTYRARDENDLCEQLAFVGSRLVFLIDWNKARKRLRTLVGKSDAIGLIAWAAANDYGHMAFLRAGGEALVFDALDFAAKGRARFGDRLEDILGRREAFDYLRFVLKTCSDGARNGESDSFMQDAVRVELLNHLRSGNQLIHDIASTQAAFVAELATSLRDTLIAARTPEFADRVRRNAARAKDWEHRADALVNQAREATRTGEPASFFRGLVESGDDIADALEEASFHLSLAARAPAPALLRLSALAELVVQGAQEYVKIFESVRTVRRGGPREDMQDLLESVHRIMLVERRADEAQREFEVELATGNDPGDPREWYTLARAAGDLEAATDAMMHCGLRVRDYALGQVLAT